MSSSLFDKSIIFKKIESNFKMYSQIKKEYECVLNEHIFDYKTGGSNGKALINDKTANEAIREIEPPYISKIYIDVYDNKGNVFIKKIKDPLKWVQLYEWVKENTLKNKIQSIVFNGRYIKGENHTVTTVENNISTQLYFDARSEILHTALAGACQMGIIKVM